MYYYDEEHYLLRYNAVYSVESHPTFRRNMITSIFRLEEYARNQEWLRWRGPVANYSSSQLSLHSKWRAGILLSLFDCEDGGDILTFQRATWHYILEDNTLHNHRCENLKSYILLGWSTRRWCKGHWIWKLGGEKHTQDSSQQTCRPHG
jgi:hypothetical protein